MAKGRPGMVSGIMRAARVAGIVVLGAGALLLLQYLTGNFHTVAAGQFYRSGQLSARQIEKYHDEYGIRTIINLRGENDGRPWYDAEVRESRELGIDHVDFEMSARHELSKARAEQLLEIFRSAQKPILVHCQGGADRTGLAASLYMASIAKAGEFASELQLSVLYGHFGIPYVTETYAMDETWENLESWLGFTQS